MCLKIEVGRGEFFGLMVVTVHISHNYCEKNHHCIPVIGQETDCQCTASRKIV